MDIWCSIGFDFGSDDEAAAVMIKRVDDAYVVIDMLHPGRVIEGECVRIEPVKPQRGEHGRLE